MPQISIITCCVKSACLQQIHRSDGIHTIHWSPCW